MVILNVPSEDQPAEIAAADIDSDAGETSSDQQRNLVEVWRNLRDWKDPSHAPGNGKIEVPELRGLSLRHALRALEGTPLTVEVSGTGLVVDIRPPPGTAIDEHEVVRLYLEATP